MNERRIEIDGRAIGDGCPPYIIAEVSGNHNGDIGRALAIMEAAAQAGASAIKLQTYTADTMTIDHDSSDFKIEGGLWDGNTLYELYEMAHTPWEWHEALFAKGQELGVTVFSTPFDESAVDFLENLNAPAFKIASFEASDLPLVRRIAKTGKPVILSTGMASLEQIEESVATLRENGCKDLVVLHCVSGYPTLPIYSNLRTIPDLRERLSAIIGLSDHTLTNATAVASVALGAAVIEKHVTLHRSDGGPDAAFSLEPDELARLVEDCKTAGEALGFADYEALECEKSNLVFKRSIYVVEDIRKGEPFSARNIRSIRPGYGLEPKHIDDLVSGRHASRDLSRGTPLDWDMVS